MAETKDDMIIRIKDRIEKSILEIEEKTKPDVLLILDWLIEADEKLKTQKCNISGFFSYNYYKPIHKAMANFKPEVTLKVKEFGEVKTERKKFSTYRELVKNMKSLLERSYDDEVCVLRSRRGEWGEWFERWGWKDGQPHIYKVTWL